ncbi:MAG: flagellar biosynthesis protein FlhB [Pirellula sp.]|jgi:flagellar biosynthetic protein FlhB
MAESAGEKKHEATDYRRWRAREEGNVPKSQDLGSSVLLLIGVILLDNYGGQIGTAMIQLITDLDGTVSITKASSRDETSVILRQIIQASMSVLPLMAGLVVTSLVVHFAQVGPLWLPQKLAFDIQRIDPLQGFQRLLSLSNVTRLGFGLLKILLVAGILLLGVWFRWNEILALGSADLTTVGKFLWATMMELCRNVAIALVALSVVDLAFQRWKYDQDLRMTDEELREEYKMTQGDPHTKSRRRQVQRELAQQRLAVDVPKADVVVTNPTELAVALKYDPKTMKAPIVLAKGADLVAAKIRRIALENGIPIVERKPLAQALFKQVDIGKPIPTSEYSAVAEVLKYVYEVKGRSMDELTETLQETKRKAAG